MRFVTKKFGRVVAVPYICTVNRTIMKKIILSLCLFCAMLGMPQAARAMTNETPAQEALSEAQGDIKIVVRGNSLRVTGAAGQTLEIYSVTGAKLKSVKIGANDETVNTGLSRGCYIIKVGDVVRKVSLG